MGDNKKGIISRRNFLVSTGLGLAGIVDSGCPSDRIKKEVLGVRRRTFSFPHSSSLGEYDMKTVIWTANDLHKIRKPAPFVYISHGFGSFPFGHIDTAIDLASQGYIVACPDHKGDKLIMDSVLSELYPGVGNIIGESSNQEVVNQIMTRLYEEVDNFPEYENLSPSDFLLALLDRAFSEDLRDNYPQVNQLINDVIDYRLAESNTVFKGIEEINKKDFFLKGKIDLENISLIGHSLGGYTVLGIGGVNPISNKKEFEDSYDFTKYENKIKSIIAQSPVSGNFTQEQINNSYAPRFWMVGELDVPAFNIIPENLYKNGTNTPEHFMRIENGGHSIYDNYACLGGIGESFPDSLVGWLEENTGDLIDNFEGSYGPDCSNYQQKQDLIAHYVNNFLGFYALGIKEGNDNIHIKLPGISKLKHRE